MVPHYSLSRVENLGFLLGLCWHGWGPFFLQCLTGVEFLLSKKFSVLLSCPFFDPLSGEHWVLLFLLFFSLPVGVFSLPIFKSRIYQAKRKPRGFTTMLLLGS